MNMKADIKWKELEFGYYPTDYNVRYTWKDGKWGPMQIHEEASITMHIAAVCLHYGQESFEGLKAYETSDGRAVLFRAIENAKRMRRSAEKILMQPVPEEIFMEAVHKAVNLNKKYLPPHGHGASMYVRPLLIGTGPQVGVKPAEEYTFMVFVSPVGPYFKTGFKPVKLIVEEEIDRAAPGGVGDVKVGGNYAAGMRASFGAKKKGYTEVLYLDAKEKKYLDESGPANFFGITKEDVYVTPESPSILPSITNMSLVQLARDAGLKPQRRKVDVEEIFDFAEAGCCGTAAVITPVKSITYGDRTVDYCPDGEPGRRCLELYTKLTNIQTGDEPDPYGWVTEIPED